MFSVPSLSLSDLLGQAVKSEAKSLLCVFTICSTDVPPKGQCKVKNDEHKPFWR